MAQYKGFSTVSSSSQKKFVLVDNALVKQDLLNVLMIRRGSRVMQPNLGCIVWEKLFETLSATDVSDIADNIGTIVNSDPRLSLISIDITQNQNTIVVTLMLLYTQTNQTEQLILNFNSQTETTGSF